MNETQLLEEFAEAVQARKSAATPTEFVRARAREQVLRRRVEEAIGPIKKGAFHAWLGKPPNEPITEADIARGLAAGGHPARMAAFARSAKGWSHKAKKGAKKAVKAAT